MNTARRSDDDQDDDDDDEELMNNFETELGTREFNSIICKNV